MERALKTGEDEVTLPRMRMETALKTDDRMVVSSRHSAALVQNFTDMITRYVITASTLMNTSITCEHTNTSV